MAASAPPHSPNGSHATGPNGRADPGSPVSLFGLDAAEMAVLRDVFGDVAGGLGLDGSKILDGLAGGLTLGQVLGLPPNFGEVLYARAHNWFAAGRHERAEGLFRALCIIDGRTADYWVGYGVCLRRRDNRAEAAVAFATAAALRPDWAVPYFHAAELAIAGEDWAGAAAHLRVFQEHEGVDLPAAMRKEAARLRKALSLRSSGSAEQGAP